MDNADSFYEFSVDFTLVLWVSVFDPVSWIV